MSPIPLGVLASSGFAAGSYDLLSTTILTSSQASVTFSNLNNFAADYQHLQIRWTARSTGTADLLIFIRPNGVTTGVNTWHQMWGNGSSVQSLGFTGNANQAAMGLATPSTFGAGQFAAGVTDILDPFSSTKSKTVRSFCTRLDEIQLSSGLSGNTAAWNSIQVMRNTDQFAIGSRFSLFGIRKVA